MERGGRNAGTAIVWYERTRSVSSERLCSLRGGGSGYRLISDKINEL